MDINMRFRASSSSGLLLWSGRQSDSQEQRDENDDFLALGLDHGYLTLAYNLGSGEAVLRYNLTRLDDDLWHRIRAVRWEQTRFTRFVTRSSSPFTCAPIFVTFIYLTLIDTWRKELMDALKKNALSNTQENNLFLFLIYIFRIEE